MFMCEEMIKYLQQYTIADMEVHQNTPELNDLAQELKKRVVILFLVYGMMIVFSFVLFLICELLGVGFVYFVIVKERIIGYYPIIAAACLIGGGLLLLKTVLSPLFGMFFSKDHFNKEIKRKNYPELFALIDEVVKAVNCNPPKHVYLSNDNNAFVNCPTVLGYLFHGAQDLTIGIPLLFGFNRSEFKSTLSHEFGHFSQDAVSINIIANLSEFICRSIWAANKHLENDEQSKIKAFTSYLTGIVNRVMLKQYNKLAPINGKLSRALEFDADKYSYRVVGTEASLSALNKLDEMSNRWDEYFIPLLKTYVEEGRAPEDVYDLFCKFSSRLDRIDGNELCPTKHFRPATGDLDPRIERIVNTDTHPSMNKRYKAIGSYKYKMTKWDNLPALDFFPREVIQERFNSVIFDLRDEIKPRPTGRIKKDVQEKEFLSHVTTVSPLLSNFFNDNIFYYHEVLKDLDTKEYNGFFPFTESNAIKIKEYICARSDYFTLLDWTEDKSQEITFLYDGVKYTNKNVPIAEQREIYSKKYSAAFDIAVQCHLWMIQNTSNDDKLWRCYDDMVAMKLIVEEITKLWNENYDDANLIAEQLRSMLSEYFEKQQDGCTVFDWMCENLDISKEDVSHIINFMIGGKTTKQDLYDACREAYSVFNRHYKFNWAVLKRAVVMPSM